MVPISPGILTNKKAERKERSQHVHDEDIPQKKKEKKNTRVMQCIAKPEDGSQGFLYQSSISFSCFSKSHCRKS